jgi:hypothetical protein
LQNLKVTTGYRHLGLDGRIILKQILDKESGEMWAGFNLPRIGYSDILV